MPEAKSGDKVTVHYTGKLQDGTIFDSTTQSEPMQFTIGEENLIPGFEAAVIGMSPGESKSETIVADEGYGSRSEEKMLAVDRGQFPTDLELNVGQQIRITDPQDRIAEVTVAAVSDATVTLDANHPLAGQDLFFEIELLAIA